MTKTTNDAELFREAQTGRGKRDHQKIKPYLVMQYLLDHSDEEHTVSAAEIVAYFQEYYGIDAERRSIYKDIDEINKVLYMLENECSIQEAEEVIDDEEEGEGEKFIVYDKNRKGFFVRQRKYDLNDVRLLAECVYSARFIDEKRARRLVELTQSFVSEWQSEKITHDALLIDRTKTTNTSVYYSVETVNRAMNPGSREVPHTPEKITFKYQKYSIEDVNKTIDRRKGNLYKVSPFRLLINDGNYYMLAFDDKSQQMRTYRVDRMKAVNLTGEARDGEEEYRELDIQTYTQRVFGMFGGKRVQLTLRFTNDLLDTVIDRFGTKGVRYAKADEKHFTVSPEVEISVPFFSWLCGFGNKVKIIGPDFAAEQFRDYLDKIRALY